MNLDEFVLNELQYLANPSSNLPNSIVAFGVSPNSYTQLFTKAKEKFEKVRSVLNEKRAEELRNFYDETRPRAVSGYLAEIDRIHDKYQALAKLYSNRPELVREIREWRKGAGPTYEMIQTELSQRLASFKLFEFSLKEFYQARERMRYLRENCGFDEDRFYYNSLDPGYIKSDFEVEYEELQEFISPCLHSQYVFIHDFIIPEDLPMPLERLFDWFLNPGNYSKWIVVCIEQNREKWSTQVSNELKTFIDSNFKIFDQH